MNNIKCNKMSLELKLRKEQTVNFIFLGSLW